MIFHAPNLLIQVEAYNIPQDRNEKERRLLIGSPQKCLLTFLSAKGLSFFFQNTVDKESNHSMQKV